MNFGGSLVAITRWQLAPVAAAHTAWCLGPIEDVVEPLTAALAAKSVQHVVGGVTHLASFKRKNADRLEGTVGAKSELSCRQSGAYAR
jgi:hypothetical protein